jgi:hypothetical protein
MLRAAALVALLAGLAAAVATGRADDRPVLHEDFRSVRLSRGGSGGPGVVGAGQAGKNPAAIAAGDKLLPEPEVPTKPDSPVFGKGGMGTDRATEHRPDDVTGADGTLQYTEVFNPAVVPFKRMTSFDAVRPDYTLYSGGGGALTDLEVGGAPRAGHDRFWAAMQIELRPGVDVAIPSVAADMRILSYETTPRTTVTFSRDGADNYYVRGDEAGSRGTFKLVFLAEADPRFFVPEVPDGLRVDQLDRARVRPLPGAVEAVARRALRKLGLSRRDSVKDALDKLVGYHRAFQAGDRPPDSGDIYWDLFDSQRGVCRHRAFTFMITANALGIPARFLGNEAHAWVEVHLPNQGWARIDLGGAALELQVHDGEQKTMYQPRGRDPFAKPKEYTENYTQLTGEVSGLSDAQRAEARTPRERPGAGGGGAGGGDGGGDGGEPGDLDGAVADPGAPVGPGQGLPSIDPAAVADRQPTRTRVLAASEAGFRGETIEVRGAVDDGGQRGVPGLKIDIYLAPRGEGGDNARLIGHAQSDDAGRFTARVTLPRDLELADHEVFAATSGDSTWQPSISR